MSTALHSQILALHSQILAQIAAARIPLDDHGVAFEVLVASERRGRQIDNLRAYVARVRRWEDRLTSTASFDAQDEDGNAYLHEVVAAGDLENPNELRDITVDEVTEDLLGMLCLGAAALANMAGTSRRTMERRIKKTIENTRKQKGLWEGNGDE